MEHALPYCLFTAQQERRAAPDHPGIKKTADSGRISGLTFIRANLYPHLL